MEDMASHCVWMDNFIPINVRRNASSYLYYGNSIPMVCVVESQDSFPPIRLVCLNNSYLRAYIYRNMRDARI